MSEARDQQERYHSVAIYRPASSIDQQRKHLIDDHCCQLEQSNGAQRPDWISSSKTIRYASCSAYFSIHFNEFYHFSGGNCPPPTDPLPSLGSISISNVKRNPTWDHCHQSSAFNTFSMRDRCHICNAQPFHKNLYAEYFPVGYRLSIFYNIINNNNKYDKFFKK